MGLRINLSASSSLAHNKIHPCITAALAVFIAGVKCGVGLNSGFFHSVVIMKNGSAYGHSLWVDKNRVSCKARAANIEMIDIEG